MTDRANLNPNRNILKWCAVFFWKCICNEIMGKSSNEKILVYLRYTRMIAEYYVLFPIIRILCNMSGLDPVYSGECLVGYFPISIGRSPLICKSYGWEKQKEDNFEHSNLREKLSPIVVHGQRRPLAAFRGRNMMRLIW